MVKPNTIAEMDTELFISSVRKRRPVWDQQLPEHQNRYILISLWTDISEENNISVEEARKKWKSLRDYYRSSFRRSQEANDSYQSSWPFFSSLHFLRDQFNAETSSGNVMNEHHTKKSRANLYSLEEVYVNPDSPNNDHCNDYCDKLPSNNTVVGSSRMEALDFTHHPSEFRKQKRHDHDQTIEETMLKEKKQKKENEMRRYYDEDMAFFESLKPHLKRITGVNKLMFRNEVQNLVIKFGYHREESDSSSSSTAASFNGSGAPSSQSERPNTSQNVDEVVSVETVLGLC
ncbi:uncharacterized protein LOC111049321 isoform X2 [Nilaparvata lugens]|nr:uncharacterized protein LOC111049321 isoform X2 [Nilaparvata lugens]XP_039279081.1 uncharacterized protein LOC111049321 isoform X2 [Nilaparvata lugens]XP_039279082.1 uncharacterized protein LOC111049321 isoform X2 [Nilaparvata lugens]